MIIRQVDDNFFHFIRPKNCIGCLTISIKIEKKTTLFGKLFTNKVKTLRPHIVQNFDKYSFNHIEI